jgi:acetolactate synthase-1/2/3 large subunit
MTQLRLRSGGQILVDQLVIHGADMAFCVPGESYLEVLDALHDAAPRLRLINARHEAGAANMAEAYGKLTGRPGICLVTRGPGACHASVGVHTAFQDSSPMILLVGQVGRDMMDREAFQEIDYRQMFGPVAKWAAQIDSAARIPEYMARAFHVAMSGRPGPVVLALPEDMLTEQAAVADAEPAAMAAPNASPADLPALRRLLERAERPLLLIGGPNWTDEASRQIVAFAEANNIPASCSFRRQDAFDNRSRVYAGDLGTSGPPALIKRAREADLLLVVGARLGEMTTQGYTIMNSPEPRQTLVHVHADADELGRVYRPTLAIQATSASLAAALAGMKPVDGKRWAAWTEKARADYLATLEPTPYNGELDVGRALANLRDTLPKDAIVVVEAGNHSGWPQRYLNYGRPGRQLGPTSGAMGYSVPAAVAAKLVHPERLVLCFVGDGGFMMCGTEMSTAAQYGANVICLVANNRMYGTIRMHQERDHPTRVVGTELVNPDFAELGRVLGCHGELVTRTDELAPALERAIKANKPAIIEMRTDPNLVTTRMTITALREAALARAKENA